MSSENKVDRFFSRIKDHPLLSVVLIFAICLSGLASFTDSITKIVSIFSTNEQSVEINSSIPASEENSNLNNLNIVIYYQNDVARKTIEIEKRLQSLGATVQKTIGGPNAKRKVIYYTSQKETKYAVLLSDTLKEYGFSEVSISSVFDRSFEKPGKISLYFYVNKYTVEAAK